MRCALERLWVRLALAIAMVGGVLGIAPASFAADGAYDGLSPQQTVRAFLHDAERGDFEAAAAYLDLSRMPPPERAQRGPDLAEDLYEAIVAFASIDVAELDDTHAGRPQDGDGTEVIAHMITPRGARPVVLERELGRKGAALWRFSRETVDSAASLRTHLPTSPLREALPPSLSLLRVGGLLGFQWVGLVLLTLSTCSLGWLVARAATSCVSWLRRTPHSRLHGLTSPMALALGAGLFQLFVEDVGLPVSTEAIAGKLGTCALIVAGAWGILRSLAMATARVSFKGDATEAEDRRQQRTRYALLSKILWIIVVIAAAGLVCFQFDRIRNVGVSILASAGLLGVVLGFAAQKSLAGLIAGVQVMLTQPIRLGDNVVVDGEYGCVEEIHLTYAVVRFWDERRYVVPIGRFLDQPFENWTRGSPELCASVVIHADYAAPLDDLRAELGRVCQEHPCWDGRYAQLVVRDATERSLVLRALVSARNADDVFVLRWDVREALIRYLQQHSGGRFLPRVRFQQREEPSDATSSPKQADASLGRLGTGQAPGVTPLPPSFRPAA